MDKTDHFNTRRHARLESEARQYDGGLAMILAICFIGMTLIEAFAL